MAEVPPCVWLSEMMAKSFWRHYDINNLTQDYRKVKEESKETMALEVVLDGKNDKLVGALSPVSHKGLYQG